MLEISPQELASQLDRPAPERPHLLDVRTPEEFDLVQLPNSQLIPLAELAGRLGEIPPEGQLVVLCHHGSRSLQAAGFLRSHGREAFSLRGGLDAWALQIDKSLPRY